MTKLKLLAVFTVICTVNVPYLLHASGLANSGPIRQPSSGKRASQVSFIQNIGQFAPQVRFQAREGNRTWWFTGEGVWLTVLRGTQGTSETSQLARPSPGPLAFLSSVQGVSLHITLDGLSPAAHFVPGEQQPTRMNYFLGNDVSRWRSNVPVFASLIWHEVVPGVDLAFGDTWQIIANVQSQVSNLRLRVEGASRLWIDADGQLVADTSLGPVQLSFLSNGDGLGIESVVQGNSVHFAPRSDRGVVRIPPQEQSPFNDPSDLIFSTYLGATSYDGAGDITVSGDGTIYVTGTTNSSDFPTTPGAFDRTCGCGIYDDDIFLTKMSADGSSLVFSTYLGGGNWDSGISIALGEDGSVYLAGATQSSDFPTTPRAPRCRSRSAGPMAARRRYRAAPMGKAGHVSLSPRPRQGCTPSPSPA